MRCPQLTPTSGVPSRTVERLRTVRRRSSAVSLIRFLRRMPLERPASRVGALRRQADRMKQGNGARRGSDGAERLQAVLSCGHWRADP